MESLQLTGPAGKLAAELLLPASFDRQTQRCDLVILMHGFLGGRAKQPMAYLSRILTEAGHAVLLRRKLLRSHVLDFLRNLPAPRATDDASRTI